MDKDIEDLLKPLEPGKDTNDLLQRRKQLCTSAILLLVFLAP
jgi:hypothetical protein